MLGGSYKLVVLLEHHIENELSTVYSLWLYVVNSNGLLFLAEPECCISIHWPLQSGHNQDSCVFDTHINTLKMSVPGPIPSVLAKLQPVHSAGQDSNVSGCNHRSTLISPTLKGAAC